MYNFKLKCNSNNFMQNGEEQLHVWGRASIFREVTNRIIIWIKCFKIKFNVDATVIFRNIDVSQQKNLIAKLLRNKFKQYYIKKHIIYIFFHFI